MSRLLAMSIPILPGKEAEWQQFVRDLKDTKLEEFQSLRRKFGVRERTFYQQTPQGSFVVVTMEGEDPENALRKFAAQNDSFSRWFFERAKAVHGFDLSMLNSMPFPQQVLDSGPLTIPTTSTLIT